MTEILIDLFRIQKKGKVFSKWKSWENTASKWVAHVSPFRPPRGDIENYPKILKEISRKEKVLILGALVLRTIESASEENFLKTISNLLIPSGFFIARIHFINEDILKLDSTSIIKEIFDGWSAQENRLLEDLITSRLFDINTDFNSKKINQDFGKIRLSA